MGLDAKTCAICGTDVAEKPRTRDAKGRYFCKPCIDTALARKRGAVATALPGPAAPAKASLEPSQPKGPSRFFPKEEAYVLESAPPRSLPPPQAGASPMSSNEFAGRPDVPAQPSVCPSCDQTLSPGTVVCVPCGINVTTCRSFVTAEQGDTDRIYENARGILWFVSWILWFGILPISSEAHGARRPYALRAIAALTVFFSVWMWWYQWTDSPQMQELKQQFQWMGEEAPDPEYIEQAYEFTSFGDRDAFEQKKSELRSSVSSSDLTLAAFNALPPSQRCFGEFHAWQLLTSAFLHEGLLHLGGNLLFLLIFGSAINALIGNLGTLLLYPLLAIVSALADQLASSHEMPVYGLGASGAIMGLAGMYFVLFPVSPVHVAAFVRVPMLLLKLFQCRGFWILLYYISWDVFY